MIEHVQKKLKGRCSWYDMIITEGRSTPVYFKDNRIYSIRERQNSGYGLRANVDNRTGFSYTNKVDSVDEIVDRALETAGYGDIEEFDLPSETGAVSFEPYNEEIDSLSIDTEIDKGKEAVSAILDVYPDVMVDLRISGSSGSRRIYNSEGIDRKYRYSNYSASISAAYTFQDGKRLDIWEGLTSRKPSDFKKLADKIVEKIEKAVSVRTAKSGKIEALITPKAFSSLLGILKAGLSAKSVHKGISPFADKLGERVFSERLSIMDRPLLPESIYSFPFDDEGITAMDKDLIKGGVISLFVSDLKCAHKLGIKPSGNASRGYSSLPVPSFSNSVVSTGSVSSGDIIKNIKYGVLVDQFIGLGQSNNLTGDFSANLDLAYLIENGEITGRVKDCMISDNLFRLLSGDIELSSDSEQSGSSIVPYIYFPEVSYSG